MVRVTDIKEGYLNLSSTLKVSSSVYEEFTKKYSPSIGDIVISRVGTYGIFSYVAQSQHFCLGQNTAIIHPKIENKFLYYSLLAPSTKQFLESVVTGSTQKTVSLKNIKAIPIALPSERAQKSIANILSTLDDKIELNQKINENLYEMVNAYFSALFKGANARMTTIGAYAEKIYSGGTPSTSNATFWNGSFGWLSSGETRNRFVISTEKTITESGVEKSSTKLAHKFDIVMASAGQGFTRGQTSMLLLDTYVNQSLIVIHANHAVLPYLFWNLANRYEELRAISDSSSIRGSLTTKMIASFEIPKPDNTLLQAFSELAWSIIPQIENNLLENERLVALRDELLPKLMYGEIDVSAIQL